MSPNIYTLSTASSHRQTLEELVWEGGWLAWASGPIHTQSLPMPTLWSI